MIKIESNPQAHSMKDVPGDNNVEAVLKYYKEFDQFAKNTKEGQIMLKVGTKIWSYKKIRENAIEDYLKSNKAEKNVIEQEQVLKRIDRMEETIENVLQIIMIIYSQYFFSSDNQQAEIDAKQAFKAISQSDKSLNISRPQFRTLPNIGNTCFWNSAVQVLFQIREIRQYVKKCNSSKENILYYLRILFEQMSKQISQKEKISTLKNIQRQLEKCLLDYVRGSQYDAFETFLMIFNLILQQEPSLSQLFQIEFSLKCSCSNRPLVFSELKIDTQLTYCDICKEPFQSKMQKVPEYLIVLEKEGKKANAQLKELQAKGIDIVAKVIYQGNKHYGHYYTLCREDTFYSYNDNSFSQITSSQYINQKCQFSIYGKVQPIKEKQISKQSRINCFMKNVPILISASIFTPIAIAFLIATSWPDVYLHAKLTIQKFVNKIIEICKKSFKKIVL